MSDTFLSRPCRPGTPTRPAHHVGTLVSPCNACEVRDIAACAPLNPDEQKRLADIMQTVEAAPRELLFEEAEPAEYVFNLTAGAVKLYKLLPDGRRQITGFLLPGDFLGLTHEKVHAYSAEALTRTQLCRFPRQKLERLLQELPRLEHSLLGIASHELAAAQDQMMLLGRKTAGERLASFLLMMSASATRRGLPADPVTLPMTRSDIADYLGLTIETVSRTFTRFRKQKLIELLDDKHVRLLEQEGLRHIAGGL